MMNVFLINQRATADDIGLIPSFLDEDDPRPAREQFNERYAHGGGWRPFAGFKVDHEYGTLTYPGNADGPEETYEPIAAITLRDEMILIYQYAWVMIVGPDKQYEIARMD